jgi:DNA polymerase-3 subunit delta'
MSFKEIVNQEHVVKFLLSVYRDNKNFGSYLFLGQGGTGRTKVAKEFAKLINCSNAKDDCCDECQSCKKISSDKYLDVHWLRPVDNEITIDQVRELEKYMYLKPYESDKKIFIICDAQCLNLEASNALLKTLEEPTKDTLIILIANDATTLLSTITSRCQKVVFNSIDAAMIKDILMHKHNMPLSQAHFMSYLAHGSLDRALEFKDLKDNLLDKRTHILNTIYYKNFSVFRMEEFNIKDSAQKRNGINLLLDILLSWFRDLLFVKAELDRPLVNWDKNEELSKLNSKYSYEDLFESINTIANTRSLINSNINVKLAISKMRADLWK